MTEEQLEVLNITVEVMRGVVMAVVAMNPEKAAALSSMLQAFSRNPEISPVACKVLEHLAEGPTALWPSQGSVQ